MQNPDPTESKTYSSDYGTLSIIESIQETGSCDNNNFIQQKRVFRAFFVPLAVVVLAGFYLTVHVRVVVVLGWNVNHQHYYSPSGDFWSLGRPMIPIIRVVVRDNNTYSSTPAANQNLTIKPTSSSSSESHGTTTTDTDRYQHHQQQQQSVCFRGDSDCPPCPPGRDESVTSLLHLSGIPPDNDSIPGMVEHVQEAQTIIIHQATNNNDNASSIVRLEDLEKLHSSLNYWCCHTPQEQEQIASLVRNLQWSPIPLTIAATGCNVDHDDKTVYLLSIYDQESQQRLYHFVRRIEEAMRQAGIPVINPRHQDFHSTLARVKAHVYPVDKVVANIHKAVPFYATFNMTKFEMNGEWIHANK